MSGGCLCPLIVDQVGAGRVLSAHKQRTRKYTPYSHCLEVTGDRDGSVSGPILRTYLPFTMWSPAFRIDDECWRSSENAKGRISFDGLFPNKVDMNPLIAWSPRNSKFSFWASRRNWLSIHDRADYCCICHSSALMPMIFIELCSGMPYFYWLCFALQTLCSFVVCYLETTSRCREVPALR